MSLFPQRFIDDLRLQANIVQVIQEYVPLKRAGRTYKGLCPFHGEKTPSFHVDPERGFFHCFGCNAGGDVFKFLELHEKVAFPEAVRMLAGKFGVPLPDESERTDEDGRQNASLRESLLKVHEVAAAFFREQLATPGAAKARAQLTERAVTDDAIEKLGLGYAPREGLGRRLREEGFSNELLLQSGMVTRRDSGEFVDRFRHRLMIPICRDTGSVIAFGGRAMETDQVPKYLNSPETAIYSKGRTLYGLNLTKGAIRKTGFAVLVEGYFDFAQVFQTQAAPVIASCGTALTQGQARLLARFTRKVVLSYDPDAAGEGAAARSCELLVTEGFNVNVVALEKGEDPDTFVRKHGPDAYRERLRASQPYLEYLLEQASTGVNFARDESRKEFLSRMLMVAANIPDAVARDQFADRIAHKARITEDVVRTEIRKAAAAKRTTVTAREIPGFGQWKPAERALIWGLFHRTPDALGALAQLEDGDLEGLPAREVFEVARSLHGHDPDHLPSELLGRLSTMNVQLVTGIAGEPDAPVSGPDDLADCVRSLKRLRFERERASIQREIDTLQGTRPDRNDTRIDVLLNHKRELGRRIEELTEQAIHPKARRF